MQTEPTSLPGVLVFIPDAFGDARGQFFESFNQRTFQHLTDVERTFVQDNHSRSVRHVLRGLHYQVRQPQGKLVRVVEGEIFDVAVDIRRHSRHFGHWAGVVLSADNRKQLWVPEGFAHGFLVLSETAQVLYKTTDYYAPEHERSIAWNDPEIGIAWPAREAPILSSKDAAAVSLAAAEVFA